MGVSVILLKGHHLGGFMNINVSKFYNDYHVINYVNGNVVSCYRDTPTEEVKVKESCIHNDSTNWGPQYEVKDELETNDVDGREYIYCEHNIVESTEGYMCLNCGTYYPAMINDIVVEVESDGTNHFEFYDISNPELRGKGGSHKYNDPEEYDTYGGLLPEVSGDHAKHECCEIQDVHAVDMDNNRINSSGEILETGNFSKDSTELSLEELVFWRKICWYIGHCPKKAIDYCKKHSNAEWFDEDTKRYVWEMVKEDNLPKYKYAQMLMIKAKMFLHIYNPKEVTKIEWNKPVITNVSWKHSRFSEITKKATDSWKYPGKEYTEIMCVVDGKHHVKLQHVDGCSNWIPSHKNMTKETMNQIIDLANS